MVGIMTMDYIFCNRSAVFATTIVEVFPLLREPSTWVPLSYSDTYASFSSSSIGMHCKDSRTDSPQSLLFFSDTTTGTDKPRRYYECGVVVQGPRLSWLQDVDRLLVFIWPPSYQMVCLDLLVCGCGWQKKFQELDRLTTPHLYGINQ